MITSSHNPKIQRARLLMDKASARRSENRFIIEGVRLVEEASHRGFAMETVFYHNRLSQRGLQVIEDLAAKGAAIEETSESVLSSLSDTETSQGIIAVLPIPTPQPPANLDFALVLDTLRDPGNVGTILRTAAAAGVQAVFLSPGCADVYAPKVVRSAMGAHFCYPIYPSETWDELPRLLKNPMLKPLLSVVRTEPLSKNNLWTANFRQPVAVMVSNEAHGASAEAIALSDLDVTIPMPGHFESLNAAIAAGIILFEVVRQRNQAA